MFLLDFDDWFDEYKDQWTTVMDVKNYYGLEKNRLKSDYQRGLTPEEAVTIAIENMTQDAEIR